MSSYFRAYSNLLEVRMDEIEPRRNEYDQCFTRNDQREVDEIIDISLKNLFTPIETLLKHIHKRYSDPGLQLTLIHKLFASTDSVMRSCSFASTSGRESTPLPESVKAVPRSIRTTLSKPH